MEPSADDDFSEYGGIAAYLQSIGLRVSREIDDEINAWCPAHFERTGHADAKPSFSFNSEKGVGNCFSCGWHPNFGMLVEQLTGAPPDPEIVQEHQSRAILRSLTERKQEALPDFTVNEWTLHNVFQPIGPKLREKRHLTKEAVDSFDIRYDPEQRTWVIPIRDVRGALIGWQRKARGFVRTEPKGLEKGKHLFGLNLVVRDPLVVVESPLDAVRLHQAGIPAVATLGAEVSEDQRRLMARHASTIVAAFDNDPAGARATRDLVWQFRKTAVAVLPWLYGRQWQVNRWKDPGECPDDAILQRTWRESMRCGL